MADNNEVCQYAKINETSKKGRMRCGYGGRRCPHQVPGGLEHEQYCKLYSNPDERRENGERKRGVSIEDVIELTKDI